MKEIVKSSNSRITGNMVDLVHHYRCMIQFGDELNKIILKANSIPQRNINWSFSTEALSKLVQDNNEYG